MGDIDIQKSDSELNQSIATRLVEMNGTFVTALAPFPTPQDQPTRVFNLIYTREEMPDMGLWVMMYIVAKSLRIQTIFETDSEITDSTMVKIHDWLSKNSLYPRFFRQPPKHVCFVSDFLIDNP